MSDSFRIPLEGSSVQHEGDGTSRAVNSGGVSQATESGPEHGGFVGGVYRPPEGKLSLHRVSAGFRQAVARQQGEIEYAPEWQERNGHGGFKMVPRQVQRQAEPQPQPPAPQQSGMSEAQQRQLDVLTAAVAKQYGIEPDGGPQMPNPATYDFYDQQSEGEYHQALQAYIQAQVNAALEPHQAVIGKAKAEAEMQKDFDAVRAKHGDDPNFRRAMIAALELVEDSGYKLSIADAYAQANDPRNARPGQRGSAHLPEQLRRGPFPKLGQIMAHNRTTGRAGGRR